MRSIDIIVEHCFEQLSQNKISVQYSGPDVLIVRRTLHFVEESRIAPAGYYIVFTEMGVKIFYETFVVYDVLYSDPGFPDNLIAYILRAS